METTKFSLSLPTEIFTAIETEAEALGQNATELCRDILVQHTLESPHLPNDYRTWLRLYRSLSQDVADIATQLLDTEGFSEDLTARAVRQAQSDPNWLERYRNCIKSDDIFGAHNPLKTSLNQNIGYRVRMAVGANVQKNSSGRPLTGSAKGLIIKTFSKLQLN